MMGISKASELAKRVTAIETLIRFYGYLHDRLKYLQPSVSSLIEQAAGSREFEELEFISRCHEKMINGKDFAESWESAVNCNTIYSYNVTQIIINIANTLGTSDLESQLEAIEYDKSRLEQRLIEVRDYAEKHKKLYQTLGVVSGLGLSIFIV